MPTGTFSNRSLATQYLRYWYNASALSARVSAGFITYQDFLAKVDTGNFLDTLGSAMKLIRQDKVQTAYLKLAQQSPFTIPSKADFISALAAEANMISFGDVTLATKEVVAEDVEKGASLAIGGLKTYVVIIALGAALTLFGPQIKKAVFA